MTNAYQDLSDEWLDEHQLQKSKDASAQLKISINKLHQFKAKIAECRNNNYKVIPKEFIIKSDAKHDYERKIEDQMRCAHHFYSSSVQYVKHISSALQQNAKHKDEVKHQCQELLKIKRRLCTNCINLLLSEIPYTDIINISIDTDTSEIIQLRKFLVWSIFAHRKSYRLIVKCLRFETLDFGYLCDIVLDGWKHLCTKYTLSWVEVIDMFFLSTKYWTKCHLIYFVNNNFVYKFRDRFQKSIVKLGMDSIVVSETCAYIFTYIQYKILEWPNKFRNMIYNLRIRNILNFPTYCTKKEILKRRKRVKKKFCFIECGSVKCNKSTDSIHMKVKSFKVCGGCKMSYYCSKSCQKKDWNGGHSIVCKKLKRHYGAFLMH
eukprot:87210_1